MAEPWVINASPVILLAKAGLIQHVPALAQQLVVPEPVAEEIRQCRTADAAVNWINGAGRSFVQPPVSELASLRGAKIGSGERSVISWAAVHRGFIALLDDHGARVFAERMDVPVLGSVGVILRLKRAGLAPAVKPHLLDIRNAGGYIGEKLFSEALRNAGEEP